MEGSMHTVPAAAVIQKKEPSIIHPCQALIAFMSIYMACQLPLHTCLLFVR